MEESARHAREPDVIRLCLDVNVWVGHYLTMSRRPRAPGAMSGLARAVFAGACGAGQIQLVVSHAMLNTLELVMRRFDDLAPVAHMARDQVEAAAGSGLLGEPPSIILGGTAAYPLLDEEDAAVLNTAMAARADLLVTANMADFIRGPKARTETKILVPGGRSPACVLLSHPKLPGGLLIATPSESAAWLLRGKPMPEWPKRHRAFRAIG